MSADEDDPLFDPGAGVTFEDLPERWKRYSYDRALCVWEYQQALRREQVDRRMDSSRAVSRYRDQFKGPGRMR